MSPLTQIARISLISLQDFVEDHPKIDWVGNW